MFRRPLAQIAALLVVIATGGALAQHPPGQGPRPVGTITLKTESVPMIVTLPGRAVARAEVAIRPRVDGFVTEVLYDPAKPVVAGAPMFRIDPTTYQAAVEQAQANLASAKAAVPQVEGAYERSRKLQGSGSTPALLEEAKAAMEKARADAQAAEAALRLAQTELSWTTITSPLAGMASIAQVTAGDLVTAGQSDALATVTELDPIDVDMFEPSARMQRIRNRIDTGQITMAKTLDAELTLENGKTYDVTGEIVAPGYAVSTSTGSIDMRFRFGNPELRVLPGMFVRGRLEIGQTQAILIPQLSATRERDGTLTAWIAQEGKAAKRQLTDDGIYRDSWIIVDGLKDGELLIVNGLSNLVEGAEISATPVTIDENGVVIDQPTPSAATE
ncbi:efflux RND transporter periplasmic adaptor subunit [Paracoccus ravus]|uniref:efflux RND transporter periplasmic adaptor subunit n=1 Tax=Paracoccus ravus TaxID=2447760 RepID=UPI00106EB29A|nr:efflux RND transporter periplasmic adaptor subunit [Paracoccus ravus]